MPIFYRTCKIQLDLSREYTRTEKPLGFTCASTDFLDSLSKTKLRHMRKIEIFITDTTVPFYGFEEPLMRIHINFDAGMSAYTIEFRSHSRLHVPRTVEESCAAVRAKREGVLDDVVARPGENKLRKTDLSQLAHPDLDLLADVP